MRTSTTKRILNRIPEETKEKVKDYVNDRISKFQKHLIKKMIDDKLHIVEIMDWTNDLKTTYNI